jgi:hypothetical protein
VEFAGSNLTSYAGLELFSRYLRLIGLNGLIRSCLPSSILSTDFGVANMIRLLVALVVVGGRRISHVAYLGNDPLVGRFAGLKRIPNETTISRWLKKFRMPMVGRLQELNARIVALMVRALPVKTLTIDVDGTVVSTGQKVGGALRGFNPHRRKVPSYYPITAMAAETGHVLRVQNRAGNVHDGKASIKFLRDVFQQVRETLGSSYRLVFRFDAAFFMEPVFRLLHARGADYAIKVPFWNWLDMKSHVHGRKRWARATEDVDFFEKAITAKPWGLTFRVVFYRRKVNHPSRKNFQLDLFDPADGHYEYSAVATTLSYDGTQLWHFMAGRGVQEKIIGELKDGLAFDSVPTNHYQANSAWQQIVALVHNLLTNFQIETGAPSRKRTRKKTGLFRLKRIRTLRFELFNLAGQILRPAGTTILRLNDNLAIRSRVEVTAEALRQLEAA